MILLILITGIIFIYCLNNTINYVRTWIIVFFPPHDVQWKSYLGAWKEPDTMNEHDDPTPYMYTYNPETGKSNPNF